LSPHLQRSRVKRDFAHSFVHWANMRPIPQARHPWSKP
jgi:hypothetical protein